MNLMEILQSLPTELQNQVTRLMEAMDLHTFTVQAQEMYQALLDALGGVLG